MRLATYVDPQRGHDARFGIVSGDAIVDVVAAADGLHRAVPATTGPANTGPANTGPASTMPANTGPADSASIWEALSRGDDPTAGASETTRTGSADRGTRAT